MTVIHIVAKFLIDNEILVIYLMYMSIQFISTSQ